MLGLLIIPLRVLAMLPGPVVDGDWLVENYEAVVLLDTRKQTNSFAAGHIPGAILVDVATIRVNRVFDT